MLTVTTKEPTLARFTSDKFIVKDRYYYKGNEISWNRPAQINDKYYPYFHKKQDENKERISGMKTQEVEDRRVKDEARRNKLIDLKAESKLKFETRVKERDVLQRMSNQPVSQNYLDSPEEDNKVVYNIVSKRLNSGKQFRSDEFSWNNLDKASKKNIQIYLGEYSVKGEEAMIDKIKERLQEENNQEEINLKKRSEFHDGVRIKFMERQQQNSKKLSTILRPFTAKSSFSIKSPDGYVPTLFPNGVTTTTRRSQINSSLDIQHKNSVISSKRNTRESIVPSVDRLTMSREANKKEFSADHPDLKGMLIKNIDDPTYLPGNEFHEALISRSRVFHNIVDENQQIRKATSNRLIHSRPPTSLSNKSNTIMSRPLSSQSKLSFQSNSALSSNPYNNYDFVVQNNLKPEFTAKKISVRVLTEDSFSNKSAALQEIDEFENTFCRGPKKIGYSRVNLEEAHRLTSAQGLAASQKMSERKKELIIK